jgi:cell division protein FtsL
MTTLTAVAAVCVAALVFGVLLEQVILAQSAFKLARVRERMAATERRHQELLLEMTELQSPERIERYARAELGMVEPANIGYVVADVGRPDRGVALLRPAAGLPPATAAAAAAAVEARP